MTSPVRVPRPSPRALPAAAPARSRPDLRVVGAPARRSRSGLVVVASTVVVFAALLAGAVAHSLLVGNQVRLDQLGTQVRVEQELLQQEELELATLQSPPRITAQAERLGMAPADTQVWLSPDAGTAPVVTGGPSPTDPATDDPDGTTDPRPDTTGAEELAGGATAGRP